LTETPVDRPSESEIAGGKSVSSKEETGIHFKAAGYRQHLALGRNIHRVKLQVILSQILSRTSTSRTTATKIKLSMKERPSGEGSAIPTPLPLPRIRDFSDQKYPDWVGIHKDCLNDQTFTT
jgi:hypothetical protein